MRYRGRVKYRKTVFITAVLNAAYYFVDFEMNETLKFKQLKLNYANIVHIFFNFL